MFDRYDAGEQAILVHIFFSQDKDMEDLHEGKLQVELAQLRHLATRLVRGWTHLERQKGGIGLRGPGETQLETDRRLLRNRIHPGLSHQIEQGGLTGVV